MKRIYDGKDLAKILIYYGLVADINTSVFNIICPFHEDINPSMRVDLEKGEYFCFGCTEQGGAYDFIKKVNPELNDLQNCLALEKVVRSKKVGSLQIKYKRKRKVSHRTYLNQAKDYFYGLHSTDWNSVQDTEEIAILEYMEQRGFSAKDLNVAGCRSNIYNKAYPFLFPILDNGEFRGWVGRTTNKYVEKKRKYLYNDGFYKRETLCGNYEENCIPIICEGFMDYLAIRTRGKYKNVVALLGWHLSDGQYNKLKQKGITTVISFLDNDECGRKGTEYLKKFFNVIRPEYPEGKKDAGEMDGKQIKQMIKQARKMT